MFGPENSITPEAVGAASLAASSAVLRHPDAPPGTVANMQHDGLWEAFLKQIFRVANMFHPAESPVAGVVGSQ